MAELAQDPLFLACTRPAMVFGIPVEAMAFIMVACGEAWIVSRRPLTMIVVIGACYLACRALTAIDHNIFRILFLWIKTKGRASRNAGYWLGSSSAPMALRAPRRPAEIAYHA